MTHTVRNDTIWRIPVLLLGVALLLAGCGPTTEAGPTSSAAADTSATEAAGPATVPSGYHRACKLGMAVDKCPVVKDAPATTPAPPKPAVKPPTVAQQQAIEAAQQYVDLSGFSRAGLIQQLASKYGNGFSKADATYAVDHIAVDWNAEAVEAAQSYLEMGGFSKSSLTKQLTSKYGSQFTKQQAAYAVKKVGL